MFELRPWATSFIVMVCNCGFWLYCFNRINAIGLSRKTTKRLEKLLIFLCFATPCAVFAIDYSGLIYWLGSGGWWPQDVDAFRIWGTFCLVSGGVLGPPWLESRRWIWPPKNLLSVQAKQFDVGTELKRRGQRAAGNRRTALLDSIPGNQITQLEVNRKELQLPRPIASIDGLKIGHISDLHFTGRFSLEFHHFVIDQLLALQPQLIVITGDIIDYDRCLPWIEPVLGRLRAPLGCVYVLGNHDKRITDVGDLVGLMDRAGHFDAGRADRHLDLPGGGQIYITGNERPWFERHHPNCSREPYLPETTGASPAAMVDANVLRLGVSHSPDQIIWARRRQLDLLLAGHTHGGQVRIPGIGPLVSPSRFGSRFASGVFYREPVLMHVSRGISGTHALRWRCLPEISLLTLRC